jgi:hypothetical protein
MQVLSLQAVAPMEAPVTKIFENNVQIMTVLMNMYAIV